MAREKLTEPQKLHDHPRRYNISRGLAIIQGVGPARRIFEGYSHRNWKTPIGTGLGEIIDWARVGFMTWNAIKFSEGHELEKLPGKVLSALKEDHEFTLPGDKKIKIPGVVIGAAAGAAVAGVFGFIRHAEQERKETALKEAPEEADAVKLAYDQQANKKVTAKVEGKDVELTGTQFLALSYAYKYRGEMLDGKSGDKDKVVTQTQMKKAFDDARDLIQKAFDSANPNQELQDAIKVVAGDAYEAILLGKELPETAEALTSRQRDKVLKDLKALPERKNFRRFVNLAPGGRQVESILAEINSGNGLQFNNLNLDPTTAITKGSEGTFEEIQAQLASRFNDMIAAEKAVDATGKQVDLINSFLPTGLKVSGTEKDGTMNKVLAVMLTAYDPTLTAPVGGLIGVLDRVQNSPKETFGEDIAKKFPSYRRKAHISA